MNTPGQSKPKLALAPFLLVDALFLGLALVILLTGNRPLLLWEACAMIVCTALGAWSITFPVLRRYTDDQKACQADVLTDAVAQIKRLEELAAQIANATAQWQSVQASATKISDASNQVLQSMDVQVKTFTQQLDKADDAEKRHLRLEVEKLRRSELDWLQVLIRVMDHIYALNTAAQRSGQPTLIAQLGQFQEACRDAARRIGLSPLVATPGAQFDAQVHQLIDEKAVTPSDAQVAATLACGFSFQGQLIRRAVVELAQPEVPAPTPQPEPQPASQPEPKPTPAALPQEVPGELFPPDNNDAPSSAKQSS